MKKAAEWLFNAHEKRERFAPLPPEIAPRSLAEAYLIQTEYVALRSATRGQVTGYKLALTTPAMRAIVGLNDSIAGDMLDGTILRGASRVRAADYLRFTGFVDVESRDLSASVVADRAAAPWYRRLTSPAPRGGSAAWGVRP